MNRSLFVATCLHFVWKFCTGNTSLNVTSFSELCDLFEKAVKLNYIKCLFKHRHRSIVEKAGPERRGIRRGFQQIWQNCNLNGRSLIFQFILVLFLPQTIHFIYCQLAIAKLSLTLIRNFAFTSNFHNSSCRQNVIFSVC